MFTLARIKPLGLGAPFGFDMPSFEMPSFEPLFPGGLPLAAGSGDGGGGGAAPPAPPAGSEGMQPALPGYFPQPTYLFPAQEIPATPAPAAASQAVPPWAILTGVGLAGLLVGTLLFRK